MRLRSFRLIAALAGVLLAIAGTTVASAQTDPYTDDSVPTPPVIGAPTITINVTVTTPGQRVRVQGCNFTPGTFIRMTLNPGTTQTNGAPCAGAQTALSAPQEAQLAGTGGVRQLLHFEQLAQTSTTARCPYDHPFDAAAPDTTAGGGLASTRAESDGCVDVWVTIPRDLSPGSYEMCAVTVGQPAACAVLKLVGADKAIGRGFARTGLMLLPWVLGAIAAIAVGRYLATRSRKPAQG